MNYNSVLRRVLDVAMCCNEDDMDKLAELINPTNREEMTKVYEETLGYNPITYFDKREIEDYLNIILLDAPQAIREPVQKMRESIVEETILHKNNLSQEYLISLLNLTIDKLTGWRNKKYPILNIEEEFIEIDEDEDLTDDLEEDYDFDDEETDDDDDEYL